jgi:hypothetical protein
MNADFTSQLEHHALPRVGGDKFLDGGGVLGQQMRRRSA